jgi:hypothetical protein
MSESIGNGPRSPRAQRHHYVWLAIIMAVGLALRAGYLGYAVQTPDYSWQDPDGYIGRAQRLVPDGQWRWTFDAVTYQIANRRHALPPGFSVVLSFFLLFPGFPLTAQIGFMLLGIVSLGLIFELGRLAHSPRAGLIAAGASAIAVPNIIGVWSTSQEGLYVPLILFAFVLVARATVGDWPPWTFSVAGTVFGVAALTRSMPLFFVVPAAVLLAMAARRRTRGIAQAVCFVIGFLVPTVPYTVALSRHFGEIAVIDTHGSIHQAVAPGASAPTILETAAAIWQSMSKAPSEFLFQCLDRARTLLHINGGRILGIYVIAGSYASAVAWKTAVHVGTDFLLIVTATLAPLGAAMCRQPRVAAMWILWAAVNVGIASIGGFSGARLRAPFEPLMIVLAATVLAGGWSWRRAWVLPAAALSVVLAATVLAQLPRSLAGWPDYGIEWPSIWKRDRGRLIGPAGVSVPAFDALAEFGIEREPSTDPGKGPTEITVRSGGITLESGSILPGELRRFKIWWPPRGLAFLRIEAGPPGQSTTDLQIVVDRP